VVAARPLTLTANEPATVSLAASAV
jgi:hypothetical protein